MKKLLFDLITTQPSRSSRFHGGGAYGQRFFLEFLRLPLRIERQVELTVALNPDAFLPDLVSNAISEAGIPVVHCASQDELVSHVEDGGYDRFYTPISDWLHERADVERLAGHGLRATMHQLRNLDAPADPYGFFLQPSRLKRTYRRVFFGGPRRDRVRQRARIQRAISVIEPPILTDSYHSKYQIVTEMPQLRPEDVLILDPPIPDENPEIADASQVPEDLRGRRYLFVPNANRPSKNVVRVIAALHRYQPKALEDTMVVLSGLRPDQYRFLMRRYPGARRYVTTVVALDQPVFNRVIKDAMGLLYPSISEGFGYPPLEAMILGTPVLASSATAVVETAGDAALYFNPYSLGEIAARITWFLSEPDLRKELVERGNGRVEFYRSRQPAMAERFAEFLTYGL